MESLEFSKRALINTWKYVTNRRRDHKRMTTCPRTTKRRSCVEDLNVQSNTIILEDLPPPLLLAMPQCRGSIEARAAKAALNSISYDWSSIADTNGCALAALFLAPAVVWRAEITVNKPFVLASQRPTTSS